MTNFNDKQLNTKWKNKKQSCSKRGIKMLLTKEEFCFLYNNHDMICEYTGEKMNTNSQSDNFISLERIDETLPYQAGNICFVTQAVNQIKGGCFDHKVDSRIVLQGKHRDLFFKLVDILKDNDKIESLKQKYSQENINKMMEKQRDVVTKETNPEIKIAQLFSEFGLFIENQCNSEFKMTYSEFKKCVSLKLCQITKRPLPQELREIGFFVIDKSAPITKGNVLVTTKTLQDNLDSLIVKNSLTLKELKLLSNVLINKL